MNLFEGIKTLNQLIGSGDIDKVKKFVRTDEAEEVVFNVLDETNSQGLSNDQANILKVAATERMSFLKGKFKNQRGGRDLPGKMEFDTTLAALRDFEKKV